MEYANTITNTSLPAKHPIHYIKWWSGDLADESPVCGAKRMDSTVWGYRTQYVRHVTCPDCLRLIEPGPVEQAINNGSIGTGPYAPHAFECDKSDAPRVRYGAEDIPHCAVCGQAENRPVHRGVA